MVNLRVEVRKMLWGNAGNRCAYDGCDQRLISDLESPDQALGLRTGVIGEEAHVRSSKVTGPRHDPSYPRELLDEYENLVLLCPTHHTIIEKDKGTAWPVATVVSLKSAHEARVDSAMGVGARDRAQLEVALAARIDRWEVTIDLAAWEELTHSLNWVHPYLGNSQRSSLAETASWLARVVWPPQYPKLSSAFETHQGVLDAMVRHIADAFVLDGDRHTIRRRHKEAWFGDPDGEQRYTDAISEFGVNDAVTGVLVTELTRSVNLVVAAVNDELLPLYRFNDGSVQMLQGDLLWGMWSSHPRYEPLSWESFPKAYDLSDIKERVKRELRGGDPRNGLSLSVSTFDPSFRSK